MKPKILEQSKKLLEKHNQEKEKLPVEERLHGFQNKYEANKQNLYTKYEEKCSFKPEINANSKRA